MASHLLGVLEPAIVLEVNRDARCPPGVRTVEQRAGGGTT
jgi:hypothetical protein